MIIKMLMENTSCSPTLESEHGLSMYIKTEKHKILFDTGASDAFLNNALKMGVPISDVDIAVISHGHYDYGGGIIPFLQKNIFAKIYIRDGAFGDYYTLSPVSKERYIGLDKSISESTRIHLTSGHTVIDDEIEIFSNVGGSKFEPSGNKQLFEKKEGKLKEDTFHHEQNLVIREKGKTLLMAGCAHRGVANIMEHFYTLNKSYPTYVIGGFHLYNRSKDEDESPERVYALGEYLKSKATIYYTCHCTGITNYNLLKEQLGKQIDYLSTGSELTI